jgi:phage baseplate assembly protein W
MTRFGYPYRIGADGRTAGADREAHLRGLIEQILFTRQGERVNRPDFGAGVHDMVFSENAPEIAAAVQHMVQAAVQRWLSDAIELRSVETQARDATLAITVRYRPLDEPAERVLKLVREV